VRKIVITVDLQVANGDRSKVIVLHVHRHQSGVGALISHCQSPVSIL
jgi:hypothetical protein